MCGTNCNCKSKNIVTKYFENCFNCPVVHIEFDNIHYSYHACTFYQKELPQDLSIKPSWCKVKAIHIELEPDTAVELALVKEVA